MLTCTFNDLELVYMNYDEYEYRYTNCNFVFWSTKDPSVTDKYRKENYEMNGYLGRKIHRYFARNS